MDIGNFDGGNYLREEEESSQSESISDGPSKTKNTVKNMFDSTGNMIDESTTQFDEEADEKAYEPRISREDLKIHISGTILSMVNV